MRVVIAAASVAALALLSSCDQEPAQHASAGTAIQPPCNCKSGQAAKTTTASTSTTAATADKSSGGSAARAHGGASAHGQSAHTDNHHRAWRMAAAIHGQRHHHWRRGHYVFVVHTSIDHDYRANASRAAAPHDAQAWNDNADVLGQSSANVYAENSRRDHGHWFERSRRAYSYGGDAPYNYVSRSRVYSYNDDGYGEEQAWHRHVTFSGTMSGERLDPWHGYDVDCDHR